MCLTPRSRLLLQAARAGKKGPGEHSDAEVFAEVDGRGQTEARKEESATNPYASEPSLLSSATITRLHISSNDMHFCTYPFTHSS